MFKTTWRAGLIAASARRNYAGYNNPALYGGIRPLIYRRLVSDSWTYGPLFLYMAGKLCITMAFATVYIFTAELFPTTLRHSLLGICSMTGRVGSILSPQTPLLVSHDERTERSRKMHLRAAELLSKLVSINAARRCLTPYRVVSRFHSKD